MKRVKRKDAILYLLYANKNQPISGRTRLQKMLFLLQKECPLRSWLSSNFDFEAWRYGPFSSDLLRDIEFLENVGLIRADKVGFLLEPERGELDALSQEYFDNGGEYSPDQLYAQEKFSLTQEGIKFIEERVEPRLPTEVKDAILSVKSKYNRISLANLLRYVYAKYPRYALKSELRHYMR